jgi:hypothetical protein
VLRLTTATAVAALLSFACGGAGASAVPPTTQGCFGPSGETGLTQIRWNQLRNPILSYGSSGIRDIGLRARGGRWNLFFTSVVGDTPTWRIASVQSRDLKSWTAPTVWPPQAGVAGVASPDVTRRPDGTYVITYESNPKETSPRGEDKLYYRTSSDLVRWSAPRRLMAVIQSSPAERLIDPALAWTPHGLFLGYKFGLKDGPQHFEIAWSSSGRLGGPWEALGRPDISVYGDTIENYQFLEIHGVWQLLATTNTLDRPWLFSLTGNPAVAANWLHWSPGRELQVPAEGWNHAPGIPSVDYEQANSAYLCDARRIDGHFYLLYVGANELRTYGGWGHTSMGVARSTDLVSWEVP